MLARRNVEVGKYYVNEDRQRAREVMRVERQTVVFSAYDLRTGKVCGNPQKQCTRDEIIHWADREATPGETARLEHEQVEALFRAKEPSPADQSPDNQVLRAALQDEARRNQFFR